MPDATLDDLTPQLEGAIQNALDSEGMPGISVGIVRGDELAWYRGFGHADIKSRRAPDELTISRVASITKTFTGRYPQFVK